MRNAIDFIYYNHNHYCFFKEWFHQGDKFSQVKSNSCFTLGALWAWLMNWLVGVGTLNHHAQRFLGALAINTFLRRHERLKIIFFIVIKTSTGSVTFIFNMNPCFNKYLFEYLRKPSWKSKFLPSKYRQWTPSPTLSISGESQRHVTTSADSAGLGETLGFLSSLERCGNLCRNTLINWSLQQHLFYLIIWCPWQLSS